MSFDKLPFMPAPCDNCPFRKDTKKGWLGAERMQEILDTDSFVCHKTAYGEDKQKRQCAGHIAIKGKGNAFYRMALAFGRKLKIINRHLIFDTEKECVNHHK